MLKGSVSFSSTVAEMKHSAVLEDCTVTMAPLVSSFCSCSVYILAAATRSVKPGFALIRSSQLSHQFSGILPSLSAQNSRKEVGFVLVEQQQLHPLKQTTTSAHLPTLPPSFFCNLPPPPSPSLSVGQVTLNYSSVRNEKAHGF